MAYKDISNCEFGMLTAIHRVESDIRGAARWLFQCDCGTKKEIRASNVISGRVKSCGCMQHRSKHSMSNTHTYNCWVSMKQRCLNKESKDYHLYGGRGIKIEPRLLDFSSFFSLIGEIPESMEIDRIDNNGMYSVENIRLSNRTRQMENMSRSKWWFIDGIKYSSQRDASKKLGVSRSQIARMCDGYTHSETGRYHKPKDNCWSELKYG